MKTLTKVMPKISLLQSKTASFVNSIKRECVSCHDNNFSILSSSHLKALCCRISDSYYGEKFSQIIMNSTLLSSQTFPELSSIYDCCCKMLEFDEVPEVYVTKCIRGINALSAVVDDKKIIFLSRMSLVLLSEEELKFLLGHELGHHKQGNIEYRIVNGLMDNLNKKAECIGNIIPDMIKIPLKKWCRNSEYMADMAGYRCCGSIDVVHRIFQKISPHEKHSAIDEYKELSYVHPMFHTRFEKLKENIKNNNYGI